MTTKNETTRPLGLIEPSSDTTARAHRALSRLLAGDERILKEDVARKISDLPDDTPLNGAWKRFLKGKLAWHQVRLTEAQTCLVEASSLAFAASLLITNDESTIEPIRLAATAMHLAGTTYRRLEQFDQAVRMHTIAHDLRDRFGSYEEIWETTLEIGLDEGLAGNHERAETWFRTAIEAAKTCQQNPVQKQAIAWDHLTACFDRMGCYEEAIEAARMARKLYGEHEPGHVDVPLADARIGTLLLKEGSKRLETGGDSNNSVLDESILLLTSARDALLAFGQQHSPQQKRCEEQIDFAQRLQNTAPR